MPVLKLKGECSESWREKIRQDRFQGGKGEKTRQPKHVKVTSYPEAITAQGGDRRTGLPKVQLLGGLGESLPGRQREGRPSGAG